MEKPEACDSYHTGPLHMLPLLSFPQFRALTLVLKCTQRASYHVTYYIK